MILIPDHIPNPHEVRDIVYSGPSWIVSVLTVASGTVAGATAGLLGSRIRQMPGPRQEHVPVDGPLVDDGLIGVATQWTAVHGRLGDEQLVVDKLRMFRALQQRRTSRRRWSR